MKKLVNFRCIFYPFLAFLYGLIVARKLFAGNINAIIVSVILVVGLTVMISIKKAFKPLVALLACFLIGNGLFLLSEKHFYAPVYEGQDS